MHQNIDDAFPNSFGKCVAFILLAVIAAAGSAKTADAVSNHGEDGSPQEESDKPPQKNSDMKNLPNMTGVPRTTRVSLGEHAKMTAPPSERNRIQGFYRDVLGCPIIIKPKIDLVQLGTNYYIGVEYDDSALKEPDLSKSIWLELRTDLPEELKQKILKFGIKEIEYWDKEHFYFRAPGGQIFRLVSSAEDMAHWEH